MLGRDFNPLANYCYHEHLALFVHIFFERGIGLGPSKLSFGDFSY